MGQMQRVMKQSFLLLLDRPKVFIPKLFSAALSSLFFIYILDNLGSLASKNPVLVLSVTIFGLFILTIIGSVAFLMVASIAKQKEDQSVLIDSFKETMGAWKNVAAVSIFTIVVSVAISLPISVIAQLSIMTGNMMLLLLAVVLGISLIAIISFVSYFLPITLLEFDSFTDGFRESFNVSKNNSAEVSLLVLLSFLLLGAAFLSSGRLEKLGYIGFLFGRLLSATVSTYIFVVSPKYYLNQDS